MRAGRSYSYFEDIKYTNSFHDESKGESVEKLKIEIR
jgi:hypothetical protein